MSIAPALPPAPQAAPAASAGPRAAAGLDAASPRLPTDANASQPGAQNAWMCIAAGILAADPTDAAHGPAPAASEDQAGAAAETDTATVYDLMLSGMLLPAVVLPVTDTGTGQPAASAPAAAQAPTAADLPTAAGTTPERNLGATAGVPVATDPWATAGVPAVGLPSGMPAPVAAAAALAPALLATAQPALAVLPPPAGALPEKPGQNAGPPADGPQASTAAPSRPRAGAATLPALPALTPAAMAQRQPAGLPAAADLPAEDTASTSVAGMGMHGAARPAGAQAAAEVHAPAARPQSLLEALGDRLSLQLQRGSERAVIRLDPPMQGQLEIVIRHDATGTTQVHLSASNSDVVRQLQTLSDSLRQELLHRQHGDVTVVVSHSGRNQDGGQRQNRQAEAQQAPGRALSEAEDAQHAARFTLLPT